MFTPRAAINTVSLISISFFLLLLWSVKGLPYIGISFSQSDDGLLQIVSLSPSAQEAGLKRGDIVKQFHSAVDATETIVIDTKDAKLLSLNITERDQIATKRLHLNVQPLLYRLFNQPTVIFKLSTNDEIELPLMESRPWSDFGVHFWIRIATGAIALLASAFVWAWAPLAIERLYLMLCGMAYLISVLPSAVFAIENVLMSPFQIGLGFYCVALGSFFLATFAPLVFVYSPSPIPWAKRWNIAIIVFFLLFLLYSLLSVVPLQSHENFIEERISKSEVYFSLFIGFAITILLCWRQWINTRGQPLARAQIKWIILSVLAGPSIVITFYLFPVIINEPPLLTRTWAWIATTSLFLMLLVGAARINLFNLESYVEIAWKWFLITMLLVCIDIALIAWLNLNPVKSTVALFFLLLWIYLPLRKWLFEKFSKNSHQQYQLLLATALDSLAAGSMSQEDNARKAWKNILSQIFSPLDMCWTDAEGSSATRNRGQSLFIQATKLTPAIQLEFAHQGTKLFRREDRDLANSLRLIFERLYDFQRAFTAGQTRERDRIRRDLHDQIGHNLLSLIYSAETPKTQEIARNTLDQLRNLLRALEEKPVTLATFILELNELGSNYCSAAGLRFDRSGDFKLEEDHLELTSHQHLNLINIIKELLSNTAKHGYASSVSVVHSLKNGEFNLAYSDDGKGISESHIAKGNGLFNIESRVTELGPGATSTWNNQAGIDERGLHFSLSFPLVPVGSQSAGREKLIKPFIGSSKKDKINA